MKKTPPQMRTIDGVTRLVGNEPPRKQVTIKKIASSRSGRLVGAVIVIFIVAIFALLNYKAHSNQDNVKVIINEVGRHVLLPTEQPILATVTDKNSLKTPFLKEADDGDKILIYEKAKKVIIYRPSADRIVDIGPVELSNIPTASQ